MAKRIWPENVELRYSEGEWFFGMPATGYFSQSFASEAEAIAAWEKCDVEWHDEVKAVPLPPDKARRVVEAIRKAMCEEKGRE
jgi:hypothetical protein